MRTIIDVKCKKTKITCHAIRAKARGGSCRLRVRVAAVSPSVLKSGCGFGKKIYVFFRIDTLG